MNKHKQVVYNFSFANTFLICHEDFFQAVREFSGKVIFCVLVEPSLSVHKKSLGSCDFLFVLRLLICLIWNMRV